MEKVNQYIIMGCILYGEPKEIQHVHKNQYLGTVMNAERRQEAEIKSRNEQACQKMIPFLCNWYFNNHLRKKICYFFQILWYVGKS